VVLLKKMEMTEKESKKEKQVDERERGFNGGDEGSLKRKKSL